MLDMCKYNMASQQNSTTQSIYSIGSKEPDTTNMGHMTQHTEHTSNKHMWKLNLSEYRQLQMKKAEKPDYLQDPPKGIDRSWGNKLNVEVHAKLLARPKSLCKNIK